MDILKKEMAPITDKAWQEIISQAKKVISSNLSARKFVDINGPYGIDYTAVSTGRLSMPAKQSANDVNYGIRGVQPLIEIRKPFELEVWELDNLDRGAKDINLELLEKAAKQVAGFEEKMIYHGLHKAGIKGLEETSEHAPAIIPEKTDDFPKFIGSQVSRLDKEGVQGPYTLVVSDALWLELINQTRGYPLLQHLKNDILGGKVIVHHNGNNSLLVSERGGDFELTIGQDTTIGYNAHDTNKVTLFFTASFTYRTLSPEAVIVLKTK